MRLALREFDCGPCPYLQGREWRIEEFSSPAFSPELYEDLLAQGFRRSGMNFYRNRCGGCERCVPLRLDARTLKASKSQRRLLRANDDVRVSLEPSQAKEERFELYWRYKTARHREAHEAVQERPDPEEWSSYLSFLIESPLASSMITDYRLPNGRLVATGYLDLLDQGLSSVYFAFDPDYSKRSLGTWSVLKEVDLGSSLGKPLYYLGFWVPGSPKMDYKGRFAPLEYAHAGAWQAAADRSAALAALGMP